MTLFPTEFPAEPSTSSAPSAQHESQGVAESEVALNRLIRSGYRFVHPRDGEGNVVAVVGIRAHDAVVDVVRIDGEHEVTAMRTPGDEADVLAPRTVLWHSAGAIGEVVADVLELSEGAYAAGTGHSAGCWLSASSGRAKFLLAS